MREKNWEDHLIDYDNYELPVKPVACGLCSGLFIPKEEEQGVCYTCMSKASGWQHEPRPRVVQVCRPVRVIGESEYAQLYDYEVNRKVSRSKKKSYPH
jgi:hypothetical protein